MISLGVATLVLERLNVDTTRYNDLARSLSALEHPAIRLLHALTAVRGTGQKDLAAQQLRQLSRVQETRPAVRAMPALDPQRSLARSNFCSAGGSPGQGVLSFGAAAREGPATPPHD